MTPSEGGLVAIARSLYERFAAGDVPGILHILSPDVEWAEPSNPYNPAGGTRHGHAGFLEWARIGHEAEEILQLKPKQYLSGPDTIAVLGETTCRVRRTGKIYSTLFVHVLTFSNGKVTGFREYFDTFAAAEAFRPG